MSVWAVCLEHRGELIGVFSSEVLAQGAREQYLADAADNTRADSDLYYWIRDYDVTIQEVRQDAFHWRVVRARQLQEREREREQQQAVAAAELAASEAEKARRAEKDRQDAEQNLEREVVRLIVEYGIEMVNMTSEVSAPLIEALINGAMTLYEAAFTVIKDALERKVSSIVEHFKATTPLRLATECSREDIELAEELMQDASSCLRGITDPHWQQKRSAVARRVKRAAKKLDGKLLNLDDFKPIFTEALGLVF